MWEYTDKVKEHFLNPRNVGTIEDADAVGEVGSLACGDALKLFLKIDDNNVITDAKFQTFGCASAIASSSALTEIVIGMSVDEAAKITNDSIADFIGGLPKEKMHCSVMGRDALEKALRGYRGEGEKVIDGEMVCECFGVTDKDIIRAVNEHKLTAIEDVTSYVKAGGGCGHCHDRIQEIINFCTGGTVMIQDMRPAPKLTNLQKIRLIEKVLEEEIKPALNKDGGSIDLVDVDGNTVLVKLTGSCASCSKSQVTLKNHVEATLRKNVTHDLVVQEVQ